MCPPTGNQRLCFGSPGVSADEGAAPQLVRAQHSHLAGVRIGRARFGEAVVAVIPDDHETKLVHWSEHRTAGSDHQPGLPPQYRQPPPVPGRRSQSGRQCHHCGFIDQSRCGGN